jgi:O-succinylbenzoic acid--CoA ligase
VLLCEIVHLRRPTIVRLEHWLTLRARSHPGHTALEADGRAWSYAELDAAACLAARRLAALGVGPGDRVASTLGPGGALVELLHAVPKLGAALVPLNPGAPAPELERQREAAGARLVVGEPLGGPEGDDPLRTETAEDADWLVVFTSGTSGRPRPIALTHGNLAASAAASAWNLGVDPADRWLGVLPMFHVGGLSILTRSAIYATTAVVHGDFDQARVRQELESGGITLASFVPTMLRRLKDAGLERAPALRAALLGGGPIPPDLLDWARSLGLPVVPTYGMTETASQVATASPDEALRGEQGARPLEGVQIAIAADGEVLVRGAMVAPGEGDADGWLHTGDLGRIDDAGRLHIDGRIGDTIVSGGENVAPAEVEAALLEHPAVTDAGVVGAPDPEWGEAVIAYVVLGAPAAAEDLREHCRARLSAFKVPKRVELVDSLPRNSAGKLLRDALPR